MKPQSTTLIFFRLTLPYSLQTPKNGGFKRLLNQTIKVICFPKSKPPLKNLSGLEPPRIGGVGAKNNKKPTSPNLKPLLIKPQTTTISFSPSIA
jgi:hypothetical protein